MANQFGFSFDMSRCSGCMACVVACMDQNDLPGEGPSFRQVTKIETGHTLPHRFTSSPWPAFTAVKPPA